MDLIIDQCERYRLDNPDGSFHLHWYIHTIDKFMLLYVINPISLKRMLWLKTYNYIIDPNLRGDLIVPISDYRTFEKISELIHITYKNDISVYHEWNNSNRIYNKINKEKYFTQIKLILCI